MRSILTLLGVIICVASVITVVTLTNGATVTSKVNSYGASMVTMSKPAYKASSLDPITALRTEF